MANNQVPADVQVVLPPEDPAPVENANAVEVPVAPQDNQEAVQGNDQQAQPLEVYKTIIPLHVVLNLVSFFFSAERQCVCLVTFVCHSITVLHRVKTVSSSQSFSSVITNTVEHLGTLCRSGSGQNGELHIYSILAS